MGKRNFWDILGKNYFGGAWGSHQGESFLCLDTGFLSINPSNEEIIGQFPQTRNVGFVANEAYKAFEQWRSLSRVQRADYFFKLIKLLQDNSDELVDVISLETGKSHNESYAEVMETLHMLQFTAGKGREPYGEVVASEIPGRDSFIWRKPKGVVAVISPWNFPLAIGAAWCAAPALLEGNTVIWKPSEDTPYVAQCMTKLYHQAGFPPGVFNLIHGDGKIGEALARNELVSHICFTGSRDVGQIIRQICAETDGKSCSCEMGSKSAVVVFEDANFDLALSASITSAFKLSGQRCVSAGRVLIQQSIYDKFCDAFAEKAGKLTTGDPFSDELPTYGPLINEKQMRRVMHYNSLTCNEEILLQGERLDQKGYYLTPHVYKAEWGDKAYLKEEVFGPHVALVPFNDLEDAVSIYNDTKFGLAVGVITEDFRKIRSCRDLMDYGMFYANLGCIGAESHNVFGGVKASGNGWPSAAGQFDAVTHRVAVSINHDESVNFPQGMRT